VECLVNCVIFNNGTHSWIADRETRAEHSIVLRQGEKMIFGVNQDKGLKLDYYTLIPHLVVTTADDPDVIIHDATIEDPTLHRMLALMGQENDLPVALGVIRNVEEETYDEAVNRQINEVRTASKTTTFDELTQSLEQWEM